MLRLVEAGCNKSNLCSSKRLRERMANFLVRHLGCETPHVHFFARAEQVDPQSFVDGRHEIDDMARPLCNLITHLFLPNRGPHVCRFDDGLQALTQRLERHIVEHVHQARECDVLAVRIGCHRLPRHASIGKNLDRILELRVSDLIGCTPLHDAFNHRAPVTHRLALFVRNPESGSPFAV